MIIVSTPFDDEDEITAEPEEWTNHVNYIDFIPDELVLQILIRLSPDERLVLERVNRRLRRLTVHLLHDFDHLTSLSHLSCSSRRRAILKYPNLRRFRARDSDVRHEDAEALAACCPLIEEARVVSVPSLAFVLAYVKALPVGMCNLHSLTLDMRFDAPEAVNMIAAIVRSSPRFREAMFFYPTRNPDQDMTSCQCKFANAAIQAVNVLINPGCHGEGKESVDDDDVFWDLYENPA